MGYSIPMSVAIGLTSLYGFPGTMILSQEAAKGAGETPEEVAAIENSILPKMIVAGFSTGHHIGHHHEHHRRADRRLTYGASTLNPVRAAAA